MHHSNNFPVSRNKYLHFIAKIDLINYNVIKKRNKYLHLIQISAIFAEQMNEQTTTAL